MSNVTSNIVSVQLIQNAILAEYDCAWCGAIKGAEAHSAACPVGERYKQVQQLGGVPWPSEKAPRKAKRVVINSTDESPCCLECGKPVEPFVLACNECLP